MKLSVEKFAQMYEGFGRKVAADEVRSFLKGVGEYCPTSGQHYFTLRMIGNFGFETGLGKYDSDVKLNSKAFHDFMFKSMDKVNDEEMTAHELGKGIGELGF